MAAPTDYIAFGTTLANMANLQLTVAEAGVVLSVAGGRPMPLRGGVRLQAAGGRVSRDGNANGVIAYPSLYRSEFNALILALFGSFTLSSKRGYVSMPDESGHYSPFRVDLENPYVEDNYNLSYGLTPVDVRFPVLGGILQTVSKSSNFNHTTAERYVLVDTSGGSVTGTLAAASGYTPFTIYSFIKMSASNNLVVDPNSSEQIDGASTKTVTALGARIDAYTDGANWFTI